MQFLIQGLICALPFILLKGERVMKGDTLNLNYTTFQVWGKIRIDRRENIWISDYGGMRLLKYDSTGEYKYQIWLYPEPRYSLSSPKIKEEEMRCPGVDIRIKEFDFISEKEIVLLLTVVKRETFPEEKAYMYTEVLIIDTLGNEIQRIKLKNFLSQDFAVSKDKRIYAVDEHDLYPLVSVFDTTGKRINAFGKRIFKKEWNVSEKSMFNTAHILIDREKNLWIIFEFLPIVRKYRA